MATLPSIALSRSEPASLVFTSINLSGGYFPGWGLPCSLLVHQIPVVAIILFSFFHTPTLPEPAPPPPRAKIQERREIQWMYFPKLPDISEPQGAGPESSPSAPPRTSASRTKGLVYPGPQDILSDPPLPTNRIQTLLQPALKNAPVLEPPLTLPNLVLIADAGLAAPPKLPEVVNKPPEPVKAPEPEAVKPPRVEEVQPAEPVEPAVEPERPAPIDPPTPVLPAPLPLTRTQSPELMVSLPTAPTVASLKDATPLESEKEPLPVELSPLPGREIDSATVVALSPMPAAPNQPVQLPAGEARGRFAMSPQPNLETTDTDPPSTLATPPSPVAPKNQPGSPAGGSAVTANPPSSVTISFGGASAAAREPASPGPRVTATPAGSGSGSASGFSVSSGSGSGKGAFAGITIKGGVQGSGAAAASSPRLGAARPLQTAYGVSVISTESSGGGLPSLGVFSNEQIYTVYLDMRQTELEPAPTWTLEFAVLRPSGAQGNAPANLAETRQGLVLPFPAVKKQAALPPDLVRRYQGKMVIVYAVISTEGKMEQMTVKESPDPLLNQPVLETLSQWVFRPALLEGNRVAVKALLGIPLWMPE